MEVDFWISCWGSVGYTNSDSVNFIQMIFQILRPDSCFTHIVCLKKGCRITNGNSKILRIGNIQKGKLSFTFHFYHIFCWALSLHVLWCIIILCNLDIKHLSHASVKDLQLEAVSLKSLLDMPIILKKSIMLKPTILISQMFKTKINQGAVCPTIEDHGIITWF